MSGSRRSRIRGEDRAPRSYHHQHHQQYVQRLRNPWVGRESTSSSSGHHAKELQLVHPQAPPFLQPTFYGLPEVTLLTAPMQEPLQNPPQSVPIGESSSIGSHAVQGKDNGGSRDSPGGWSRGGCGGRCPALDELCFHCLHVVFFAGLVVGVALVVTGSVLHQRLQVLIYIGGLSAAVSLILLGVQCCVQRDHVRRKQRLQRQMHPRAEEEEGIPLREIVPPLPSTCTAQSIPYHGLVLTPPPPPAAFRSAPSAELAMDRLEPKETVFHHGPSLWRQKEQEESQH